MPGWRVEDGVLFVTARLGPIAVAVAVGNVGRLVERARAS
jgi:hypothetical protein